MQPLRILILSDGRPGHFNLSEGIAAAAARNRETSIQRFEVRRGKWPGAVLATLTTSHLPAATMLRQVYGIPMETIPAADLVVSAGAETLAASIWVARCLNVPNIHYGSIRLYDPQDFSLILTSYERNARRSRHCLAIKPSRLDPGTLRGAPKPSASRAVWPPATAALVIGGDTRGITYSDADWTALLRFLATMHQAHGTSWHVANSRRTPQAVSDRLATASQQPESGICRFLDIRSTGPGTLPGMLAACDAVLCTADSSSMVSECIWMQLPTISVAPAAFEMSADEALYRSWMQNRRWLANIAISSLEPGTLKLTLETIQPNPVNQQQALFQLIEQAVPQLFDPSVGANPDPDRT